MFFLALGTTFCQKGTMFKITKKTKSITWILVFVALLSIFQSVSAFERSSRLHALNQFNVKKNSYKLIRTRSCPGCYLVDGQFSGLDLRNADLRDANLTGATFIRATLTGANLKGAKIVGANFSGAHWVDGSICQSGSIGKCIKNNQP